MDLECRINKLEDKVDCHETEIAVFKEIFKRVDRFMDKAEKEFDKNTKSKSIDLLELLKTNFIPILLLMFLIAQHLGFIH